MLGTFCKSLTMFKLWAEHQEVKVPRPEELLGEVPRIHGSMWFFKYLLLNGWITGATQCARYSESSALWSFWQLERHEVIRLSGRYKLKSHFSSIAQQTFTWNYFHSIHYTSMQLPKSVSLHLMQYSSGYILPI